MTMLRHCSNILLSITLGFVLAEPGLSLGVMEDAPTLPSEWMSQFRWRSIGPANMSGRIVSIAVNESDRCEFWVGSASGGLLHTMNNGVTFEHQFDDQTTVSIGNVAVSKSNPQVVWVGTGEANPRNSVSYGDGVYKSEDGGKTWKHMGLENSFQIGRIAIHPDDPNTVYVGALGRLWGPNEDRGLYKTTDGGETWEKILYVDDKTGVIDIDMNPADPYTLIVATYERERDGFDGNDPAKKWGPGSGLWKTGDGGKTWAKLSNGLPSVNLGRIGVDYHRADPNIVYAVVESERINKIAAETAFLGMGSEDAEVGARATDVAENGPAATAGLKNGDIILALGDHKIGSNDELTSVIRQHRGGDVVKIEYVRDREFHESEITFATRDDDNDLREFDGGLGGQRENLQERQGFDGHQSGGIYRSEDGGDSWTRINSLNPRPMYYSQIRVDPTDPKYVYVLGTSLYRSDDGGKTFRGDGGQGGVHVDHHAMWIDPNDGRHMILGNDGGLYVTNSRMDQWEHLNKFAIGQFYHVTVDPRPAYNVYGGLQDNGSWGGPSRDRTGNGVINSDWFRVGGGDGFVCLVDRDDPDQIYFESQNGGMGRINLRTGERGFIRPRGPRGVQYRFNWKTPFILSNHNSRVYYVAGNYAFRSMNKGDSLEAISPDLTQTDDGSGSAMGESPRSPNLLYVGTTDGMLWRTQDGGHTWTDLFDLAEKGEAATIATAEAAAAPAEQPSAPAGTSDEAQRRAATIRQMIERLDSNDDGKLEKSEVPERMHGMFDRFDSNGDGAIDESDIGEIAPAEAPSAPVAGDPVTGEWNGQLTGENVPEGTDSFTLTLELQEDNAVTGSFKSNVVEGSVTEGSFNRETGAVTLTFSVAEGTVKLTGVIDGDAMNGAINVGDGLFTVSFNADRIGAEAAAPERPAAAAPAEPQQPREAAPAASGEVLEGTWEGTVGGGGMPEMGFTMTAKVDSAGKVSGTVVSDQGTAEISAGTFDASSGAFTITITAEVGMFEADIKGAISGDDLSGKLEADTGQGVIEIDFKGKRKGEDEFPGAFGMDVVFALSPGESVRAMLHAPFAILREDPISGEWACEFSNEQFSAEFTLTLTLDVSTNKVTGDFSSQMSDAKIESGSFDPATGKMKLSFTTQMGSAAIEATVKEKKLTGVLIGGDGNFEVDVTGTQTKSTAVAAAEPVAADAPEQAAPAESASPQAAEDDGSPKPIGQILPKRMWVSSIEPSRYEDGRVYATFDGHRSNNDDPWVLMSEDFGETWKNLRGNLPRGSTRVVREDIANENVLYLGTEFGAWVSVDRGASWTAFNDGNLPTVAVHEFAQHPTMGEVVAATHGRALWIADVSALRQITDEALAADAWLFRPQAVYQWRSEPSRGQTGLQEFSASNPPSGAQIYYTLKDAAENVKLYVQDIRGEVVRELDAPGAAGLHHVTWDLRRASPQQQQQQQQGPGGRGGGRFRSAPVQPGTYLLVLEVGERKLRHEIEVRDDPDRPGAAFALEQEDAFNEAMNRHLEEIEGESIDD